MNLSELRAETRRRLNEVTTAKSQYSDTDLSKYLNEGIKSMCTMGGVYEKVVATTILNGIANYSCPIDFIKPVSLKRPNGSDVDLIESKDATRQYLIAGYPLYYYISQTVLLTFTRVSSTAYVKGTFLLPATANGFMYEVTVGGTTGVAAPTYPTDSGTTVADGTATLTCRELTSNIYNLTLVDTPTAAGGGTGVYSLIHKAMDEGLYVDTDVPNFPVNHHPILCTFGVMRALQMGRQFQDSLIFAKEYSMSIGVDLKSVTGEGGQK